MPMSLTSRLVHAADDLRELRVSLHNLALTLLEDDAGLSAESYRLLDQVFQRVGGLAALTARKRGDGRFYLSPMAQVTHAGAD
jgi:hypothetical protein